MKEKTIYIRPPKNPSSISQKVANEASQFSYVKICIQCNFPGCRTKKKTYLHPTQLFNN